MQDRSASSTSHGLYASASQSIAALQAFSLKAYIKKITPFSVILANLQEKGLFTSISSIDYTMEDYLKHYFKEQNAFLSIPPVYLIAQPLPLCEKEGQDAVLTEEWLPLSELITCYLSLLLDVLNNKLAQKPYEKVRDQENVTEQVHALQAAKIALLLGMNLSDVLALLFHDIARPSVDDPLHGHSNHCQEGSIILSPLGLDIDYSGYHAVAKFLLSQSCSRYEYLISDVSKYTLNIQKNSFVKEAQGLNHLSPQGLATYLFQIMFMRLIDDMSKVPELELRKILKDKETEYLSNETISAMLEKQMALHLQREMEKSKNKTEIIEEIKAKLEAAISLMLRAKSYTNNPSLYENYEEVFKSLEENQSRKFSK